MVNNCVDFCTASKCAELEERLETAERRIEILKTWYEDLKQEFDNHLLKDIPEAHNYVPNVEFHLGIDHESSRPHSYLYDCDKEILVFARLKIDNVEVGDHDFICIKYPETEVDLFGQLVGFNTHLRLDVVVNGERASTDIPLPQYNVDVGVFELEQNTFGVSVQVGDQRDQDTFTVSVPELEEDTNNRHIPSDLQLSGYFNNDILTIDVSDGESSDSLSVYIPTNEEPQTVFITEEIYMNCDELERLINNNFSNLDTQLNNLDNHLNIVEDNINYNIGEIKDVVTVDISGTAQTNYDCEFPEDENGKLIPTYAESKTEDVFYGGVGLIGIHESLKIINSNLASLHKDACKAVDPISTITIDDIFKFCVGDEIKREDFAEGKDGDFAYNNAISAYLIDLFEQSKYGYLVEDLETNTLITAPNNYITEILADFAVHQGRINNAAICAIEEAELPDVVSIVAQEKVIPKATGKYLVLHFVTEDNYPKRSRGSTYYPIQIPAAKDAYDWEADFNDLRWERGNQYAELRFEEFKNPVSGFFQDEDAANAYFDAIISLTTATEKNRVTSKHSNPKTSITEKTTRPYRAFIESVNANGDVVCHVKYTPVINP